ncbi:MAG: YebC/PmpR family DNA-binding transcriptional regulator [Verrucomicrobiia bacterium]
MGRQWLHAKRAVAGLKKSRATGKLVRDIMIAAKNGGPDPDLNAALATAVEKARKESVSRDVIERAIKKGSGTGGEKLAIDQVFFEGYAPHKIPVIVEVQTDNQNRTAPEIRVLFKKGQLGAAGSNKFLFDHVAIIEAYHSDTSLDPEEAAIEAGANEVLPLSHQENDDIPENALGAKFLADRASLHAVASWLSSHGWTVVTSEMGFLPKSYPPLTDEQRAEVGEFLQALDDHDDVHRIWAAVQ